MRDRLRERVTTTPGRLAVVSILVLAGAVCFGVVATAAERSRAQAAHAVRAETEPLLVQASALYAALADANATATTTFLVGGLEPSQRLAHYSDDLRLASDSLAALTRAVGGSSVRTITEELPIYSGEVESARANNRQGFPVGAAYLRQASALLTGKILPAADQLYATEAERLGHDYGSGTTSTALVVLVVLVCGALVLLALTQFYLARLSNRILNVPLVLATVVLAAVSAWTVVGMINEKNALTTAQRDGSDSVAVLSATQVLLSRAQSDESLTLVSRGSDLIDPVDFNRIMQALAPPIGLIGEDLALAPRIGTSAAARQLGADFASYKVETARIAKLEGSGGIPAAIRLASSQRSTAITDRLSANLAGQISVAQGRFARAAADSTSALSGLSIALPVLTAIGAALALIGLRQRLGEYR